MKEEWRLIWCSNYHWISSYGRVKSTRFKNEKIMKLNTLPSWYIQFCPTIEWRKRLNLYIHRIVAKIFIPNPEDKVEVNHIDWNKSNNNVNNLEWCTRSENTIHGFSNWLIKSNFIWSKHKRSFPKYKLLQIDSDWNTIKTYNTVLDAIKELGVSRSSISKVCQWKQSNTKWYIFKYASK